MNMTCIRRCVLHFRLAKSIWQPLRVDIRTGTQTWWNGNLYQQQYSKEVDVAIQQVSDSTEQIKLFLHSDRLLKICERFRQRSEVKKAAAEQGITGDVFDDVLKSFCSIIKRPKKLNKFTLLRTAIEKIHEGKEHIDALFPHFIDHAHDKFPLVSILPELKKISDLTSPSKWYPAARCMRRHFIIHAGPTNSGKTHHALKSFLSSDSGIYCAPLRMLAAEVCQFCISKKVPCDLVTGEEKVYASGSEEDHALHLACTVEMVNTDIGIQYDVAVIDEAQMIRDEERGGAWTRAILGVPAKEIHLCGETTVIPLIQRLIETTNDTIEVKHYDRLSPLEPLSRSLDNKYSAIKPGDCVVAFSRPALFRIKRKIEQATRQHCAIIYGGLPSANRHLQAKLFNSSKSQVKVMVATDAIGMGLNLNIKRIIFYTIKKKTGYLTPSHLKQIAGRAGRYGKDYPRGEVTTFLPDDQPMFHSLLNSPVDDIKKAGVTPVYEQINLLSKYLPDLKLHELLNAFMMTTKLDNNFFLCKTALENWITISQLISSYNLPLKDAYTFSIAPVNMNNEFIKYILKQYASYFSQGISLKSSLLRRILKWPLPFPRSSQKMILWEDSHEALDLYLWLNQRYPEDFPALNDAKLLQEDIEKVISLSLQSKSDRRPIWENPPIIRPLPSIFGHQYNNDRYLNRKFERKWNSKTKHKAHDNFNNLANFFDKTKKKT